MKKITIIEPHYDDAWINLGGFILNNLNNKIQIITLTQNPSNDSFNRDKLLNISPNISHISLNYISLGFDHDYYENYYRSKIIHNSDLDLFFKLNKLKDLKPIIDKLNNLIVDQDEIYFPMSLKHPQHALSKFMVPDFKSKFYIYREFPYYFYSSEKKNISNFKKLFGKEKIINITNIKQRKYRLFREIYPVQKFILDLNICRQKLEDINNEVVWKVDLDKFRKLYSLDNNFDCFNISDILDRHKYFSKKFSFDFSNWLNIKPIEINLSVKEDIDLLTKILRKYLLDYVKNNSIEKIYTKLNLSLEERKLISLDLNQNKNLNFFRMDFGFEDGFYKFFEINTECPGGFGDLFILEDIVSRINNKKINTSKVIGLELSKLFFENFKEKDVYVIFSNKEKDKQVINEFKIFANKYLLNRFKISYIFLEDIKIKESEIRFGNKKIKQIFRMFDLVDLIKYTEVDEFVKIFKKNNLVIVNPLSDALFGHKKIILLILNEYSDEIKNVLKEDYNLIFGDYAEFNGLTIKNKVLKKGFSTRGEETFFLNDLNNIKLKKMLLKINFKDYIVQNEFHLDKTNAIFFDMPSKSLKNKELRFDYLPFFINSKNCGAFSRLSNSKLTNHFWKDGGISTIFYK